MALYIGSSATCLCRQTFPNRPSTSLSPAAFLSSYTWNRSAAYNESLFIVGARRASPRTKKSGLTTGSPPAEKQQLDLDLTTLPEDAGGDVAGVDDGYFLPELPGDKPDFWEGAQWNAFGFFIQYLWAFGIGFALVACGIAVATYNEGATDFKATPVYKESIQSRELLEEPDASNSDVFEANPTEVAPSLE